MRNTSVILTMGNAFVNDGNQARVMLIVLVDLSDKYYNDLDDSVLFELQSRVDNCLSKQNQAQASVRGVCRPQY